MHINSSETRYKSTNSNFNRSTTEFRKKLVIKYIDFKVQQIRWKRWFVALNMLLNINLICTTINLYMRWSRPEHSHNLFKSVWAINSERQTKLFFFLLNDEEMFDWTNTTNTRNRWIVHREEIYGFAGTILIC